MNRISFVNSAFSVGFIPAAGSSSSNSFGFVANAQSVNCSPRPFS